MWLIEFHAASPEAALKQLDREAELDPSIPDDVLTQCRSLVDGTIHGQVYLKATPAGITIRRE